jgi:hypothetical protein
VFGYQPAPLIFEVRGLPRKAGERAMDAYRGVRIGLSVQCENGYFAGGGNGGWVYDNQGQRVKQFSSEGGRSHAANFIAAVRSRKASDLRAPIEGGHLSSALCHLGNISYRLGRDVATDAIREAVQAHEPTKDSLARMLDHLGANGVKETPAVLGPSLALTPGAESFVTKEKFDLGYWANTLLRRDYRPPFVVPEMV